MPAGRSQPRMYRGRFVIECGRAKSWRFLDPLVQAELTVPAQEFVYIPHLRNLYFRICRTFTFACMDSIRNNFRCVLFILFRMVFVAYKRPPWAPKGPKGPEGPLGPKPPPGPGPFHWGPGPWARPSLLRIGKARREKTLCICSGRCVQTGRRVSAERIEST